MLVGCSGDGDGPTVATDPPRSESPREAPTGPPWPSYEPTDYSFVLGLQCFCANVGTRYDVMVRDGQVDSVVYARGGRGYDKGDPVPDDFAPDTTIEDIIDAANDQDAAEVQVDWPVGQDYPSRVWVDQDKNMADEEIGYVVYSVEPA